MSSENETEILLADKMRASTNYDGILLRNIQEQQRGAEETVNKLLLNSNLDPAEYTPKMIDLAEDIEALRKELFLAHKIRDEEESATGSDLREKIENQEMLKAVLRQTITAAEKLAATCEKNEDKCRKMRNYIVEACQRAKDAEIKLFNLQKQITRLHEKELALRENSGKSGPNDERMATLTAKMALKETNETIKEEFDMEDLARKVEKIRESYRKTYEDV